MAKPAADFRSDSDKQILDAPDFFVIKVFQHDIGWVDSAPFNAQDAFVRYNNIKELNQNYRLRLCAVRILENKPHFCSISVPELTAYAAG